jgi:hypothetical protein
MVDLFVAVHSSNAMLALLLDGYCFLIASTASEYSLQQMLLRVLADGSTGSLFNALYDHGSSRFDIAFVELLAKTNPNVRWQVHVSW